MVDGTDLMGCGRAFREWGVDSFFSCFVVSFRVVFVCLIGLLCFVTDF